MNPYPHQYPQPFYPHPAPSQEGATRKTFGSIVGSITILASGGVLLTALGPQFKLFGDPVTAADNYLSGRIVALAALTAVAGVALILATSGKVRPAAWTIGAAGLILLLAGPWSWNPPASDTSIVHNPWGGEDLFVFAPVPYLAVLVLGIATVLVADRWHPFHSQRWRPRTVLTAAVVLFVLGAVAAVGLG